MKNPTSFRLSETARGLLGRLAEATGMPRAACLELAIRDLARKQGVTAATPEKTAAKRDSNELHGEIIGAPPGPEARKARIELARFLIGVAEKRKEEARNDKKSNSLPTRGRSRRDDTNGAQNPEKLARPPRRASVAKGRKDRAV
jgi:predicted transcriptional regulator